jgi:hypothetical protein
LGNAGTITVGTQLAYTVAQSIIVVYDANNFQECEVTAYNPATGSLSFGAPFRTVGGGTYSSWTINLDGASGGDGSSGTSGSSGSAGTSGTTGTSGSSGSSGSSGTSGSSGSSGTAGTSGRNGIDGTSGASIANWYGAFTSTATQVVTAANTPTAITYTNDEYSNGIVFSGSQLTVQHTGIYEIAYSLQVEKTQGGSASEVDIWLKKNGSNIIRTDSILGLNSNSTKQLPFVSIIDSANAGDYYEVYFSSDSDHVQITAVAAAGAIPAAPSIITNIKQIGIAVGTTSGTSGTSGSSGINGSSGNTGSSGSAGSSGTSGTSGLDGSTGSSGSAGSSGTSGSSGTTGTSGSSGTAGTSGTSGSSGSSGSSGTTGTSGTSATSGTTGTSGSSGTSGMATTSARAVQVFTSTAGQTTFTVANGYNLGMVDVFVNGVKLVNGVDYTATNGTTVVLTDALTVGQIVEIDNYLTAFLPTNALRTITTFTATAGQTTFSVTYTQGLIDVFYNGSNLAQSEYTATNGTSIILATACQLNDIVVVYAYSYAVGAYSGIGGSGTVNTLPKFTATATIGDSAITDNGTTVTLVSRALSGTSASFSSNVTGTGNSNVSSAIIANNGLGGSGTAQFYQDFGNGSGFVAGRILRGNGASGYEANGLNIDSFQGLQIKLNALGGSGGTFAVTGGAATFSSSIAAVSATFGGQVNFTTTAVNPTIGLANSADGLLLVGGVTNGVRINNHNNTTELFRVTNGGNVGIGTSSPQSLLDVQGTASVSTVSGRTYNTGIVSSTNPNIANGSGFLSIPIKVGDVITFFSGQVRTVTAVTDTQLTLNANWTVSFAGVTATGVGGIGFDTDGSQKMLIAAGGDININGATSTGRLNIFENGVKWGQVIRHDRAGAQFYIDFLYSSTETGAITGNNTNVTYATSSDYRLKEDLKDFNGVELVSKLNVYDFAWKSDNTRRMYGVVAHEMAKILPYAVNKEKDLIKEDGTIDAQGVDYSLITPLLVKAIQEQQAQIEELKQIVATK